jgi:hypothetical protein
LENKYTAEELSLLINSVAHKYLLYKSMYGGMGSILLFDVYIILKKCQRDNTWGGIYDCINGLNATGSNEVRKVFYGAQEDMPLYINDRLDVVRAIATWRLKIGK